MNKQIFVFLLIGLVSSAAFATKADRIVMVSGDCLRNLTPDRGMMVLTADHLEKTPGVAIEKTSEMYNKLRERIKKMNLKDLELETTEMSVNEEFDWNNNQKKSRGFRSRTGLRVITSEISKLGGLASIASELKIQEILGLQHFVSRETQKTQRESCLQEAFSNAKMKAEKLAQSSGQKLGPAFEIREDSVAGVQQPIQPMFSGRMTVMSDTEMSSKSAPQIESGITKISVSVQVGFELQ